MVSIVDKVSETVNVEQAVQLAEVAAEKTFDYSLKIGIAAVLVLAGFILARLMAAAIRSRFSSMRGVDNTLVPILSQTVQYAIIFITLIMALSNFGVEMTSLIAVLGAAGLAIGLALQGTLQNVAAGIMLLVIRPFKKGDYIESGSVGGTVDETGLFVTRMHTSQGLFIAVPNSMLWSNIITNYSRLPRRRFDMQVGISYDADLEKARDVLMQLLLDDGRVHRSPEPMVVVRTLGASSVDLEIRAWTDRQTYWDLNFDLTRKVKLALDEAEISIPYPHTQIVMSPELTDRLSVVGKMSPQSDSPDNGSDAEKGPKTNKRSKSDSGKRGRKPRNIPA